MILEIALGIVLAVLILIFLPQLIELTLNLVLFAVVLILLALLAYFAFESPETFVALFALVFGVVGFHYLFAEPEPSNKDSEPLGADANEFKDISDSRPFRVGQRIGRWLRKIL